MPKPQSVITPDRDAVIVEINVSAPAGRVFEALTDTAQLPRWFTNERCPSKSWTMDARLGGRYSYASEVTNLVVTASTNSNVTARLRRSIHHGFLSTHGSRTGISTKSEKRWCAGNSHRWHLELA